MHSPKILPSLLVSSLLLTYVHSIMFKLLSSEPTCLLIPGNKTFVIEYVVSGENDQNVRMTVYDREQFIMRKEGVNEYHTVLKIS
jgi:hypothetical protein